MAKGRMLNRRIARSRKFNALKDEKSRLTYCLLLPFVDRDGRMEADAEFVKADIFPSFAEMGAKEVESALKDLHRVGLIVLYEVEGAKYLEITQFLDNQEGFRYDREKESIVPPFKGVDPTTVGVDPTTVGVDPEPLRQLSDSVRLNRNRNRKENKNKNKKEKECDNQTFLTVEKSPGENEKKHTHGEFSHVRLKSSELKKLKGEWGDVEVNRWIKELDEALEIKGFRYKNHALVLRRWRAKEKEKPARSNNFTSLPVHDRSALGIQEA